VKLRLTSLDQGVRSWRSNVIVLLLSTGCAGDGGSNPGAPDAAPPIDLDAIGARALDTLSGDEARAVCEDHARRSDPCLERGVFSTETPAECDEFVAACRRGDTDPAALCRGITFGPQGSCSVNVEEFFRCIDARNASLQCSEAGYQLDVPDSCTRVLADCPRFSTLFPSGRPHPCEPDAGTDKPPDTNPDIFGLDGCRPRPARLVILGDSIAEGHSGPSVAERLLPLAGPNLVVESFARSGARVRDLPAQASLAAPGAGHVFVWIWAIGNDMSSTDLVTNPNSDLAPLRAHFEQVLVYFGDAGLFPDGATFLLNTQYDPYDQCDAPGLKPWNGTVPTARFLQINQVMFLDVAQARPDAVAIDQYPDFLGHGDNANMRGCPHCGVDNTPWTIGSHPTQAGAAHIGEKWAVAFEQMLGSSCGS
jgi:hypothetical protein